MPAHVHGFFPHKHGNPNARVISGSFAPAGSGSPTGAKGRGYTVERTAVGKYTLTFRQKYSHLLSALADVRFATPAGYKVVPGAYDAAARTLLLEVLKLDQGFIPLDITTLKLPSANVIINTTEAGLPDGNTAPSLQRVNGATDKALRVIWAAAGVEEVQFAPVPIPTDIDSDSDTIVNLLVGKGTNTDTAAVIDVQAWSGVGDTEMGGNTAALAVATVAKYTRTLTAANVGAHPGVLNIGLVPGAHDNDAIHLYAAWLEYTKKQLADISANDNNRINFECVFQANSGPVT